MIYFPSPLKTSYLSPQLCVFLLIYLSYAVSLIVKRNASFWVSGIVADGYVSTDTVGILGSLWETANGVGKLLSAIVVDAAASPAVLLAAALAAQGGGGLGFLAALSLRAATPAARGVAFSAAAAAWAFSGLAQAFIWPSLTRVFMSWYPNPAQRGTWYAILATSQNAGAALAPLVTDAAARIFGWRARVLIPSVLAMAFAAAVTTALADKPPQPESSSSSSSAAYPPSTPPPSVRKATIATLTSPAPAAARVRSKTPLRRKGGGGALNFSLSAEASTTTTTATTITRSKKTPPATTMAPMTTPHKLKQHSPLYTVLSSASLWLLSINYFFNSFVRNGITASIDVLFRGGAPNGAAAAANVAYELGGAIGGLASGTLSDAVFGSRRAPAMAIFGAFLIPLPLFLPYLRTSSAATFPSTVAHILYFLIGSTAFPPHVLNGLVSREVTRPDTMTAAAAFTKSAGQAGAALAEYLVISAVLSAQAAGLTEEIIVWNQVACALAIAAAISAATVMPLWNVRAYGSSAK